MTHPPRHEVPNFCSKHGGGWAFPWRNRGSALQTKRPAERFRSRRFHEGSLPPQKRTPSDLRTWGLEVCCLKIRLLRLGGGCRGMGCRPARPGERHLATRRACSMRHKLERRAVVARSASVGAGPRRLLRLGPSLKPRYLRRRGFFCGGACGTRSSSLSDALRTSVPAPTEAITKFLSWKTSRQVETRAPIHAPSARDKSATATYPARRIVMFRSLRANTVARSQSITSRSGYVATLSLYLARASSSRGSRASSRSTPALSPPLLNSTTQYLCCFTALSQRCQRKN